MALKLSPARILDFDIENRPLSYWCPDRPSAEITAIAWSWIGTQRIHCVLLGESTLEEMLGRFMEEYNFADIVTGHYILRHDLPIVNGALLELGLPTMQQKMVSDTKCHLVKRADLPVSQEALAAYLGVTAPKIQMTQADWREANRLTPKGLKKTRVRVTADVRQNKEMREKLIERRLLHGPEVWTP
jgi:hypothetical protein